MASGAVQYFTEENSEDLSYTELDAFPEFLVERADSIYSLQLDHNEIHVLPRAISAFSNLVTLDISSNQMTYLTKEIVHLTNLRTLIAKNNLFENDALPKDMSAMQSLEVVNLSGNQLHDFPLQLVELESLRCLYLGGNDIKTVPPDIKHLTRLEVLYMGGNRIAEIPDELGYLTQMTALNLCDNRIESLPRTLANLRRLQSLSLHNNQLETLPTEIVSLNLIELSLRNNPLVVRFVRDMMYDPPSLLELAGRVIRLRNVSVTAEDLPPNLIDYLGSGQQCVNPRCKGVYFSARVEHIKFVDFCGKYRLPLLAYLCSPECTTTTPSVLYSSASDSDTDMSGDEVVSAMRKMKKVLLPPSL